MANKKRFYYLIEDLDIDGDYNSDGFLITKYKINSKTKDKIFIKTKYVTFKNFKKLIQQRKKQGGLSIQDAFFPKKINIDMEALKQGHPQGHPQGHHQGYHQGYPQGYPRGYPQGYHQGYPQGYPQGYHQGYHQANIGYTNGTNFMNNKNPEIITIASEKPTFFEHAKAGFATGLGWAVADNVVDGIFDAIF